MLIDTVKPKPKSKSKSKSKFKSKSQPVSKTKAKAKAKVKVKATKKKSLDITSSPTDKPKFRTITETLTKGGKPFLKRRKRVRAVSGSDTHEEREVTT